MIGVETKVRVRILDRMPEALDAQFFYPADEIGNKIYLEYM